MWQDVVIAVVSLMFGLMLFPQLKDVLLNRTSLNLWSCGMTTIGLYVLAATSRNK